MKRKYAFPCPICGKPMTWDELYTHLITHTPKIEKEKKDG